MSAPKFIIRPACETSTCESTGTFCISLYRSARPKDGNGEKYFYQCFEGNQQVTGEQLALIVLNEVSRKMGIDGKLISAPTEGHKGQLGEIEFPDIDEWDSDTTGAYMHVTSSDGAKKKKPRKSRPDRWLEVGSRDATDGFGGSSIPWSELDTGVSIVESLSRGHSGDDDADEGGGGFHWLSLVGDPMRWARGLILMTVQLDTYEAYWPVTAMAEVGDGRGVIAITRDLAAQFNRQGIRATSVTGVLRIPSNGEFSNSVIVEFTSFSAGIRSPHFVGGYHSMGRVESGMRFPPLGASSPRTRETDAIPQPGELTTSIGVVPTAIPSSRLSVEHPFLTKGPINAALPSVAACGCGPNCSGACR